MRFSMFCRSNSATTSPFFTRPPGLGSSSKTSEKSPPPPRPPPPPPPPPMEPAENMPFAVDPRGFEPSEPREDLELELFEDVAAVVRSEKRLVEPRFAPRLDAAGGAAPPAAEPSEEEVLLAVLDEVTVIVEALCELELDE